jgi:site-specific DNA-methyltransferase (adenine-specific)
MPDNLNEVEAVIRGKRRYAALLGDCLDLGRRLPEAFVDAVIIDPPYGMSYRGMDDKQPPILNDERPFIWWLHDAFRVLKPGGALACFCQWKGQEDFKVAIRLAGFAIRSHVIWDRKQGGMGATHNTFAPRHDVIWFATKGRFAFPSGRPDSVLPFANVPSQRRVHSTQKPTDLMAELVRRLAPRGGIVYDPCMGSGSTGVAAIAGGYRFIGIEMDQHNYNEAVQRLSAAMPRERTKLAPDPRAYVAPQPHYMRAIA